MTKRSRREFLSSLTGAVGATAAGSLLLPPAIQRAFALPARRVTGTLEDVRHVVILTQENRSFDHYFGSLAGVRGFADPFPVPARARGSIRGRSIWHQPSETLDPFRDVVAPFRLNTVQNFEYTRVQGTPHTWKDAQAAWSEGRMDAWPLAKHDHSMGYFAKDDIPFQWALANAFTICDAYHCALHAGTNPNRLFIWSGTNDPLARGNGPATYNDYDWFDSDPALHGGYTWTTYPERLEAAGISWQVYEDMDDNFTDNPLAGFASFRDAWFQRPGFSQALRERGVSTRNLGMLAEDVRLDRLPQVSWIVATAEGSEHPGPSSPAQGAAYVARVLDALTANPDVWGSTVLFINFDENDGFFDHVPPPAPPSYVDWSRIPERAVLAGRSTVDTTGEYHEVILAHQDNEQERQLQHRPYGLGPRVPMYIVSPWSKGGWVTSQVHDHTSIIRFVEARFGVREPNISQWRRAVCGDFTTAFDFARSDGADVVLPDTAERAARARALADHATPPTPWDVEAPVQEAGVRPSRALPYELHVQRVAGATGGSIDLRLRNSGTAAAVVHVYDRLRLDAVPRRYTLGPDTELDDAWTLGEDGLYDLWILGPNGFHRHFRGRVAAKPGGEPEPEVRVSYAPLQHALRLTFVNAGAEPLTFRIESLRYDRHHPIEQAVGAASSLTLTLPLVSCPWYDVAVTAGGVAEFGRRAAGRMETGADSISDPAMSGPAVIDQFRFATSGGVPMAASE
jgi:phospholipase C